MTSWAHNIRYSYVSMATITITIIIVMVMNNDIDNDIDGYWAASQKYIIILFPRIVVTTANSSVIEWAFIIVIASAHNYYNYNSYYR